MVVAKGLRWFIFIMRITDWVRWAYFFVVKQNENLLYFCCWHFGLQSQGAGKVLQSVKSSPWDSFRHDKVSCFAWPELSLNWWWLVTVPLRFNQFKFPSDSCSRDSLFLVTYSCDFKVIWFAWPKLSVCHNCWLVTVLHSFNQLLKGSPGNQSNWVLLTLLQTSVHQSQWNP